MDRLSDLTKWRLEHATWTDALRFIGCWTTAATRTGAASAFLARWPRAASAPMLREGLEDNWTWTKAAVPPSGTGNTSEVLPPAFVDALAQPMREQSVINRIGAIQVPVNVPIAIETQAANLEWIGQAAPKPATTVDLSSLIIPPAKLAGMIVLTEELARTSNAEQVMSVRMTRAAVQALDRRFLDPAFAATADNPASITNGLTPVAAGATLADSVAALAAAFFSARPDAAAPTWIASPASVFALAALDSKVENTAGATLRGYPLVLSTGAANHLILADVSGLYVADSRTTINLAKHGLVQLTTTPENPATATTVWQDLWQSNLMGVLCERVASWAKEANAAAYMVMP